MQLSAIRNQARLAGSVLGFITVPGSLATYSAMILAQE
jgi:hypothetical protein